MLEAMIGTGWYDLAMIAITPAGWYDWDSKSSPGTPAMVELQPTLQRARDAGIGLVGMKAARHLASGGGKGSENAFDGHYSDKLLHRGFRPGNGPTRLSSPTASTWSIPTCRTSPISKRTSQPSAARRSSSSRGLIDAVGGYPSAAASCTIRRADMPRCGRTVCRRCRGLEAGPDPQGGPTSWPQQTPPQGHFWILSP